jgi:hypothetical protein
MEQLHNRPQAIVCGLGWMVITGPSSDEGVEAGRELQGCGLILGSKDTELASRRGSKAKL